MGGDPAAKFRKDKLNPIVVPLVQENSDFGLCEARYRCHVGFFKCIDCHTPRLHGVGGGLKQYQHYTFVMGLQTYETAL